MHNPHSQPGNQDPFPVDKIPSGYPTILEPPPPRGSRKIRWFLWVGVVVVVSSMTYTGWYLWRQYRITQPLPPGAYTFVIPAGSSAMAIARLIAETGLVKHAEDLLVYMQQQDVCHQLKAGRYHFEGELTIPMIVDQLCVGPNASLRLTIPEGFTVPQVAQRAYSAGMISSPTKFLVLCRDAEFIHSLGMSLPSLEGYLFPDTYYFTERPGAEKIITMMVSHFRRVAESVGFLAAGDDPAGATQVASGLTANEVVILASIIEREAALDHERPLMAGVFFNRLRRRMPLGASATLRYALDDWDSPESRLSVTRTQSPYNTYIHQGLPPGPICNPGRASLQAVVEPQATEMLFFTGIENRRHHFSKTYNEHRRISRHYRPYHDAKKTGHPNPEELLPDEVTHKQLFPSGPYPNL